MKFNSLVVGVMELLTVEYAKRLFYFYECIFRMKLAFDPNLAIVFKEPNKLQIELIELKQYYIIKSLFLIFAPT